MAKGHFSQGPSVYRSAPDGGVDVLYIVAEHAFIAAQSTDARDDLRAAGDDDSAIGEYGVRPESLLGSTKRGVAAAAMADCSGASKAQSEQVNLVASARHVPAWIQQMIQSIRLLR